MLLCRGESWHTSLVAILRRGHQDPRAGGWSSLRLHLPPQCAGALAVPIRGGWRQPVGQIPPRTPTPTALNGTRAWIGQEIPGALGATSAAAAVRKKGVRRIAAHTLEVPLLADASPGHIEPRMGPDGITVRARAPGRGTFRAPGHGVVPPLRLPGDLPAVGPPGIAAGVRGGRRMEAADDDKPARQRSGGRTAAGHLHLPTTKAGMAPARANPTPVVKSAARSAGTQASLIIRPLLEPSDMTARRGRF